ncbi:hypothetical protein GCK72_012748 [Caenorhabditis remanei]|uniref:CUT domain-containing protein n=1 Tax=Caenorhabditis remanei TaxID=31234 RepID=A0A6A5GP29_CAERE|nr:hypothetical protein GCK72_012748 [Caenorhabditis remanei]KAF1756295.1 hypothetical protein GCK72_012748 [Caenorhabditis remanei]
MTSFRNGSHDPEYKLTELTKVKLNFPGHNGTPRMPQAKCPPVRYNERQMIPKPMILGKRTSYGSKDLPIFFVGQDENKIEIVRIKTENSMMIEKSPIPTPTNTDRNYAMPQTTTYYSIPSTIQPTIPTPLPLPTLSSTMTVEQAIKKLTTPIPDEATVNVQQIAADMMKWFSVTKCKKAVFAAKILKAAKGSIGYILTVKVGYTELRNWKEPYTRMYNWLKMSDAERKEFLKMDLYPQEEESEESSNDSDEEIDEDSDTDHNDTPEPSEPGAMTFERMAAILNRPVVYMNTKKTIAKLKEWFETSGITKVWFSENILGKNRKAIHHVLHDTREWSKLKQGKENYERVFNWMRISEHERQEIIWLLEGKRERTPPVNFISTSMERVQQILAENQSTDLN